MKNYLFFLLVALLNCNLLFAQSARTVRVKAGEDAAQAWSPQGFYHFPKFSKAILYFKGRSQNTGLLFNYNLYSGNMQFVNPKGDTLDVDNTNPFDSIVFEKNTFINNGAFMEVIAQADSIKLLKQVIINTRVENIGAFGLPSATATVENTRNYSAGTNVYNLIINQDVVLSENISWFFTNGNNNLVKANKSNLLKLLPNEKQTKAEAYLKQNKTNFEKENDLKKLLAAIGN